LLAGFLLVGLAGGIAPWPVAAAEVVIGPADGGVTIDGEVGEWLDKPPSLLLQPVAGARSGRIWLAESEDGLIAAGRVGGPPPQFPATPAGLDGGDRVELAVTLIESLVLPKIGWSEASGPVELAAAEDCTRLESLADDQNAIADCKAWYGEQVAYRRQFLDLFARRWRLAPGLVEETRAHRAFAALPAAAQNALKPLAPKSAPIARFTTPTDSGYSFEILVPWDALPPSPVLELSRLRLSVEAASRRSDGADGAAAMLPARLEPPRRWRLSRCGYPLADLDSAGRLPGVFLPTAGADVDTVFIAENPAARDRPATDAFSPALSRTTFFSQLLAPDVAVCGPPLAVRRGETATSQPEVTVSQGLKTRPVKGGWLVADGPYTGEGGPFANDECGGCPLISLRVFYIAAAGAVPVTAFDDAWLIEDADAVSEGGGSARVMLQGDLTVIDAYEADVDERGRRAWSHVRHCYDADAHLFKECGRAPVTGPPPGLAMPPEPPPQ
jgi:hypothetical protein